MCGVAGVVNFDGEAVDRALLARMTESMTHRGPDDAGLHVDGRAALGHRRLSVIDLSSRGRQPMCNEDGTVWISFNGEIYNHVELRDRLEARGHRFRSDTDTEVILHLYEERGEACLHELNGIFGFLIWDARRDRMFGARDRIGVKPLHYYADDRRFLCASEIKAILEHPSVPREADPRSIGEYLFADAQLGHRTFFRGIRDVPPAHYLTVEDGRVVVERYWSLRYDYDDSRASADVAEQLAGLLEDAVRLQCRSDAPLGCHLSGGLDSSTVVALARRHVDPLHTFSVRFGEESHFDESGFARLLSRHAGTEHHEMCARGEALSELYPALIWHMDQPATGGADAGFSYFSTARLAADHVKVSLTGHGGDELFAGYPAQFATAFGTAEGFRSTGAAWERASVADRLLRALRRGGVREVARRVAGRLASLAPGREPTAEERWIRGHCGPPPASNPVLHEDLRRELRSHDVAEAYLEPFRSAPTDRLLDRCLHHDLTVYLPRLLHKEDRASMAVSLESRVPLLDHRIAEFLATVPPEQKVPGRVPKGLLREAASRWLPREIVQRRDKVPFAIPMGRWLDEGLEERIAGLLEAPECLDRGVFDPGEIRGGRLGPGTVVKMFNVELWFRLFIDRDAEWLDRAERGAASMRAVESPAPLREVSEAVTRSEERR